MGNLKLPLLGGGYEEIEKVDVVTRYASANFLSKAIFFWLNPLLQRGYKKPIENEDVPALAPEHTAAVLSEMFLTKWPKQPMRNSVGMTLFKIVWPSLLKSAAFAFCKVCVLFTGPMMMQSFAEVTSGSELFPSERYWLVTVLICAKMIENLAAHQYNFINQTLGMQVRSALVTALFRKGLKLSSSARHKHGVGEIVNYMSVDVQNIADVSLYLNNIWTVPCQAIIGASILFSVVGLSAIAGLLVMGLTVVIEYIAARWLRKLQQKIAHGRDKRVSALVEALSNMKIIKLQAWDGHSLKNVERARDLEFDALSKFTYTVSFSIFIAWLAPLCSCVAIFTCHIFLGHRLTSSMAFTTIATMRAMQELLRSFPNILLSVSQTIISLDRLEKFMWSEEIDTDDVMTEVPAEEDSPAILVHNGCFKWDTKSEKPTLNNINLEIKRGSLVAVVGKVGSGKSSLLAALQGEVLKVGGETELKTRGTTACVTQCAWLQSGTIQENILFGKGLEKEKYYSTLQACALLQDLSQLASMDHTEIGEKGVNLSGGQKQRIQLARALYQNSDIYFLDDIFSAVDARTGSHLFKEVITGALKGKTVILVTHQIEFLPKADTILVMRDGEIVQSGKYEELLMGGTDFEALVDAHDAAMQKVEKEVMSTEPASEALEIDIRKLTRDTSSTWPKGALTYVSNEDGSYSQEQGCEGEKHSGLSGKLTEDEHRETGQVSWFVYWSYLTRACGYELLLTLITVQIVWQVFQISGDYWVAYGLGGNRTNREQHFIKIYGTLALLCGLCVILRAMFVGFLGLTTAQSFFLGMLRSVFQAPMSFFDSTPKGRILSRATMDQQMIDYTIPIMFGAALAVVFQIMGMLYVTCRVSWYTTLLLIPLACVYRAYQTYYFATARELTRIEGVTKAPIIHYFSETVAGLVTLRCFKQEERFIQVNLAKIDSNLKLVFHGNAAMEWVGMRVETIGVAVLLASLMLLLLLPSSFISPEMVGLALTYGLSLNQYLFDLVGLTCQLENKMISVERIAQYTKLQTEANFTTDEPKLTSHWPANGSIMFENLQLRYTPQSPVILKGINVTIESGEKVGVVGRTGSGKSTLISALFRLVEAARGRILVDNVDISTVGLTELRSKISIIPQDPTLFDGTVRSNLDPLEKHEDIEIWEALEKCQLASIVRELPGKLDAPVVSDGANWSVGQMQLFCLGRVLLKRTRVLVLDEATASVDAQTDALIQKIVRQEFAHCTVISIAHRIPSVMDSDRVLVLEAGLVKEFDSPIALLENKNSLFSALVKEYTSRGD